jgi:hypothetical protein
MTPPRGERDGSAPRVVPDADPVSYYGRPILKGPVWHADIAWYLFVGGVTGASCPLALGAELVGNEALAKRVWPTALLGITISPILLIKDLGRPQRFLNMLRVFKVTSPMSVGSWIATGTGATVGLAAVRSQLGWFPRAGRVAGLAAGLGFGPGLATYTAVLLADTTVPVWHGARRELPFVFAGSAMASAGGAATALTPASIAGPARRLTALGAVLELAAAHRMESRLGELGEPLREGRPGTYAKAAKALTGIGTLAVAAGGSRRAVAVAGGAAVMAGSAFERFAVFRAGFASAADPKYTVGPQRRLVEAGASVGT